MLRIWKVIIIIIESFDGTLDKYEIYNYNLPPDSEKNVKMSLVSKETDPEHVAFGNMSLKLEYDFTGRGPGGETIINVIRPYIPIPANATKYGMWVYGDGSGYWLRYTINADNEGFNIATIDWTGWKYVEAEIKDSGFDVRKGDSYIERLMQLKPFEPVDDTVDTVGRVNRKGVIYIDQVVVLTDSEVWTDKTTPAFSNMLPSNEEAVKTSVPGISVDVADTETGIDSGRIEMYLDGKPVGCTFVNGRISFTPSQKLSEGEHSVIVKAFDNAQAHEGYGNPAVCRWSFIVDTLPVKITSDAPACVYAGNEFNVVYKVRGSEFADSIDFSIHFDPLKINVGSIHISDKAVVEIAAYDNENGVFRIKAGGLANSGLDLEEDFASITFKADEKATGESIIAKIEGGFILAGESEQVGAIISSNKISFRNHFTIYVNQALQYLPVTIAVKNEDGMGVQGARLYMSSSEGKDESIGMTDERGILVSDLPAKTACTKTFFACKETRSSAPVKVEVIQALERDKPTTVISCFAGDAKTARSFTWHTSPDIKGAFVQAVPVKDCDPLKDNCFSGENICMISANGAAETLITDRDYRMVHKVALSGLKPGTEYKYRVGDGKKWSDVYKFTTDKEYRDSFTFIHITDTQKPDITEYWYLTKILQKAQKIHPDMAFFLHTGDVVDNGPRIEDWDAMMDSMKDYSPVFPFMAAVGNHDNMSNELTKGLDFFISFYKFPDNGPEGIKQTVYSFDYGNAHFAILNTEEMEENNRDNVGYKTQIDWLRKDMSATDKVWKIVALHRCVYGNHYNYTTLRAALTPVFDELGIDLVLQGHDHIYSRTYPLYGNEKSDGKGTIYLTSKSAGKSETTGYEADPSERPWIKVQKKGGAPCFSAITITGNRLSVAAYDIYVTEIQPEAIIDSFTLAK